MTVEEAVRIVAEFDGWWNVEHPFPIKFPPYATDRDAAIAAALKLPKGWQRKWARKAWNFPWPIDPEEAIRSILVTTAETLLIALAETIQEMKGKE